MNMDNLVNAISDTNRKNKSKMRMISHSIWKRNSKKSSEKM